MTLYVQPHVSMYGPNRSDRTRKSGCTWTSGANGVAAMSGGRYKPSPDDILSLLKPEEETNPKTPGWSLADLDKALGRYGVPGFDIKSGTGRAGVLAELDAHRYVVLQGDSDQFGNSTCSGAFDGNHCIGIHPRSRVVDGRRQRWINDPICPEGRWEYEDVLWRYAGKLWSTYLFGSFRTPIPPAPEPPDTSTGGEMALEYANDTPKRLSIPKGTRILRTDGSVLKTLTDPATKISPLGVFVDGVGHRVIDATDGSTTIVALVRSADVTATPIEQLTDADLAKARAAGYADAKAKAVKAVSSL